MQEALRLGGLVMGVCPSQEFNGATAVTWAAVMPETRYADAAEAVLNLGRTRSIIAPRDILDEVRRIRARRLRAAEEVVPNVHPDDVAAYLREQGALRTAIADGDLTAEEYARGGRTLTGATPLHDGRARLVRRRMPAALTAGRSR